MTEGVCNIVGIALSEQDGALRPAAKVETTVSEISTTTAGKIFVGIEVVTPGDITLGMDLNGQAVAVADNEKLAQTTLNPSPGRFESYALDLPMRIIGAEKQKFPVTHDITVRWGSMTGEEPVWKGASSFQLVINGKEPVVKYDPVKDSD
jgi:hypothetical protein